MQLAQANVTGRKPGSGDLNPADFGLTKAAYTINEALAVLPIGKTTLYAMIAAGEIAVIRFGKRVSISAPDIADLLNRHRVASASTEAV
jgi:excisionase family DNA binding protein